MRLKRVRNLNFAFLEFPETRRRCFRKVSNVCQQCDEAYLSPDVSEKIDLFLKEYHQHRPKRYISVPEFTAAQAIGC